MFQVALFLPHVRNKSECQPMPTQSWQTHSVEEAELSQGAVLARRG